MFSNFTIPDFTITRPWTMRPLLLVRGETIIQWYGVIFQKKTTPLFIPFIWVCR